LSITPRGSKANVGACLDWQEAYKCQMSAVFLGGRQWWRSSRQLGSVARQWLVKQPWSRHASTLEASAVGEEIARYGHIAECPRLQDDKQYTPVPKKQRNNFADTPKPTTVQNGAWLHYFQNLRY